MLWICQARFTLSPEVPSVRAGSWQTTHSVVAARVPPWTKPRFMWACFFVPSPPAADTDHLVERFPAGECVVSGVHDHQAAALLHVLLEGGFQILRPAVVGSVVVEDDGRVLLEIGRIGRAH